MKKALIIGSSGQDGRLLQSCLTQRKYHLILINKKSDTDIENAADVELLVKKELPDEIYYLAAFHHSSEKNKTDNIMLFKKSIDINLFGLVNFLEAVKDHSPQTKVFYAASSHIFGEPEESVQTEETPINPVNIYGISKAAAVFTCRYYRKKYNVFVSTGILYNHESSYRKSTFLSKKVCSGVANIKFGNTDILELNNINNYVDFGFAPDFLEAMRLILTLNSPDDFIIATGEKHSIREFVEIAFNEVGLDYIDYVKSDDQIKTNEIATLVGSIEKLQKLTGWTPETSFGKMVRLLVKNEVEERIN